MRSQSVESTLLRRPAVRWTLVVAGVWTLFGVLSVVQYYLDFRARGVPLGADVVASRLLRWYNWIPLTGLVAYAARRWPLRRAHALGDGLRYAAVLAAVVALDAALFTLNTAAFAVAAGDEAALVERFAYHAHRVLLSDLLISVSVVAVVRALESQRASRERALTMAHLETQLVEAQLRALRMQLNPHFLFNTLHTISAIMDDDVKAARRLMADLSDLLRRSLDNVREQLVPLDAELDFVRRYVAIEQERLQDRLALRVDVSAEARAALVPNLILQPLVENAVRHGIAPLAGGGCLAVRARREGERLVVEVRDDGAGLRPGAETAGSGLGLALTRERLAYLYGADHAFDLRPAGDGEARQGLVARLALPYCTDVVEAVA